MEDDYEPTMRLRFIERPNMDVITAMAGKSKIRVLQQWHEMDMSGTAIYQPDGPPGEWRDVPLEAE